MDLGLLQLLELDTAWRKRIAKEEIAALQKENALFSDQQLTLEQQFAAKEEAAAREVRARMLSCGHTSPLWPQKLS